MKLTKKLTFVLATTAAACVLHADTSATSDSAEGTLGQRYGELSFTDQNISHVSNDLTSLDFGINYPVTGHLDLGGNYGYSWINNGAVHQRSNVLSFSATAYLTYAGVKPFVSLELGSEWDRISAIRFLHHSSYGIYAVEAGVEIPLEMVTVTPFIAYQDDFRAPANSSQADDFGVEVNYWFKKDWAVFADVGYQDVLHSRFDSTVWSIGLRQKF